ncbi:MAG: McrC family protein, partial [Ignavibacteria bacterium]
MTFSLTEWQELVFPFGEEDIKGLKSYLEEAWETRPLLYNIADDEGEEEEPGPPVQRFFHFKPGYIKARNYVGFVQYGNIRINVQPQVFEGRDKLTNENKIQHLLKWLSYSRRIHFPFLESSFDNIHRTHDWLEAFIFLFANYTEDILTSSPYFAYQEVSEETAFVKGRLAMNEYIHQNLAKGRHHRVYCTFEPFLYDNLFNRVVKHTCKLLLNITEEPVNTLRLQNILFLLDEVEDHYCTVADCDRIPINRMFPEVDRISNLCRLFLANQSYSNNDSDKNNLCVLLPMEVIFEELVFGFLEEHFKKLQPRRQASDMYLAKTGENFTTDVFRMKHDILIPRKLIIDTKYKHRGRGNDNKGGVNQGDLYQMVAYGYRRGLKDVLLVYPYIEQADNSDVKFLVPPQENIHAAIHIKAGSLDIVVESGDFEETIKEQLKDIH